jgi:phosphoglycerate kinase
VRKAEHVVIGGGMANTFLAAQGMPVGRSLCEHDMGGTVREVLARAEEAACTLHLPRDFRIAPDLKPGVEVRVATDCPPDWMILDAGPESAAAIRAVFDQCRTLVWNGPLGAFETPPFDTATVEAARHAAELTRAGKLVTVAGGGDTVAALNQAGVAGDFSYVSTAGGAFLEWMEGKTLPGVAALER